MNGSNKWMTITGGVLSIVSGALNAIAGLCLMFFGLFFAIFMSSLPGINDIDEFDFSGMMVAFALVYVFLGIIVLVPSIVSIIGGMFALKQRRWGWALAGAICAALNGIMGIAAVIFISMSKNEFDVNNQLPEGSSKQ